ncbi:MAG: hypothetical protein F6K19_01510 [Cyanothece sp. SIO1E1]|nr:hypothetical protein [Cyanothece sp. SIO1E1]
MNTKTKVLFTDDRTFHRLSYIFGGDIIKTAQKGLEYLLERNEKAQKAYPGHPDPLSAILSMMEYTRNEMAEKLILNFSQEEIEHMRSCLTKDYVPYQGFLSTVIQDPDISQKLVSLDLSPTETMVLEDVLRFGGVVDII